MSIEENTAKNIMNALFRKQHLAIKKDLSSLIIKNNKLVDKTCSGFSYRADLYTQEGNASWADSPKLHETLYPEIEAILAERIRMKDTTNKVDAFLRRALNLTETVPDMYAILPEQLHGHMLYRNTAMAPVTLDESTIMQFNEDNKETINLVKEQILLNLVLRSTHGL